MATAMLQRYYNTIYISSIFAVVVLVSIGCAVAQAPYSANPIDFNYQMQNEQYSLSQLRGKPVLLALVRTSEVTNEMYPDELQKAHPLIKEHISLLILSLAPNEAPMLQMFVEFHDYPFFIGIADWSLANGESMLGVIPDVPTTYLLSDSGNIIDMVPGALNSQKIIEVLKRRNFIP